MTVAIGDKVVFTKEVEEFNIKEGYTGKVTEVLNMRIGLVIYFVEVDNTEMLPRQVYVSSNDCFQPVQTLQFMNDHCTTSLWSASHGEVGPREYNELPLSKELIELLEKRDEEYTNRLNWEDPASTPERTEEELKAFEAEGVMLWRKLQEELTPFYKVTFFSEVLRRVVETEEELNAQREYMPEAIKELDVVEFLEDIRETIAKRGFTGTIVHDYCSVLEVVEVELGQEHEYELITANKSQLKLIWSCPEEEKETKQQELVDRDTNNLVQEKIIDTAYTAARERIKQELNAEAQS